MATLIIFYFVVIFMFLDFKTLLNLVKLTLKMN